jgi:GntP family gluconate:H+ symporter
MTQNDWNLIILALVAIGLLVLLVTRWKVNAFIALFAAALLVGAGAVAMGLPEMSMTKVFVAGKDPWIMDKPITLLRIIDQFSLGMGNALKSTAAIIALGIMLGKLLAESGGAEVLAKRFAVFFGAERVLMCIMALALVIGLVTWFAVGLVLLLPILFTLVRETKKPFLLLAIPLLSVLSVMHGLMPPHPGPVAAIGFFNASTGQVLGWGFLIGIPIAVLAGPMFARRAVRYVTAQPPEYPEKSGALPPGLRLPSAGLTLFTILLPVLLMLVATAAELVWSAPADKGNPWRLTFSFLGNPVVALTAAAVFASWSLGANCGFSKEQVLKFSEASVATVGMTLLVVGAGGGFAWVLDLAGVSRAMGKMAELAHLPPLLYGWLIAAFIRVATGSATVSITVAAGLMVPVLAQNAGYVNAELLIVAIGCGSLFLSHFNDGGFWIVKDCLGLTVGQTLRTWTVTETIIGIAGLLLTLAVHAVWAMLAHH